MKTTWPFGALKRHSYDLIMADPGWRFETWSRKGEAKSPQAKYRCMSVASIAALPVLQLASDNCILWLWTTFPMLLDNETPWLSPAGRVMQAWGFRYVTGGAWHKQTKNGKTSFGTGFVLRSAAEPFLIGRIGKPKVSRSERNLIADLAREHSRKPEKAYELIERWMPHARKVELFSRTTRPGWATWGDQRGTWRARS